MYHSLEVCNWDFSGSPVVKTLSFNTGDACLIPGLGAGP